MQNTPQHGKIEIGVGSQGVEAGSNNYSQNKVCGFMMIYRSFVHEEKLYHCKTALQQAKFTYSIWHFGSITGMDHSVFIYWFIYLFHRKLYEKHTSNIFTIGWSLMMGIGYEQNKQKFDDPRIHSRRSLWSYILGCSVVPGRRHLRWVVLAAWM